MDEMLKQWAKAVAEKEVYRRVVSFNEAKSACKNKLINELKEFKVTRETAAFWLEVYNNIDDLVEPGARGYIGDLDLMPKRMRAILNPLAVKHLTRFKKLCLKLG